MDCVLKRIEGTDCYKAKRNKQSNCRVYMSAYDLIEDMSKGYVPKKIVIDYDIENLSVLDKYNLSELFLYLKDNVKMLNIVNRDGDKLTIGDILYYSREYLSLANSVVNNIFDYYGDAMKTLNIMQEVDSNVKQIRGISLERLIQYIDIMCECRHRYTRVNNFMVIHTSNVVPINYVNSYNEVEFIYRNLEDDVTNKTNILGVTKDTNIICIIDITKMKRQKDVLSSVIAVEDILGGAIKFTSNYLMLKDSILQYLKCYVVN